MPDRKPYTVLDASQLDKPRRIARKVGATHGGRFRLDSVLREQQVKRFANEAVASAARVETRQRREVDRARRRSAP